MSNVFELGPDVSSSGHFTGKANLKWLVDKETGYDLEVANVTFEAGCINNWHTHPGGQILLVTSGRGWYQKEGEAPVELLPGSVIKIPKDTRHWHGASKDSSMSHLVIEPEIHKGTTIWLEPVSPDNIPE